MSIGLLMLSHRGTLNIPAMNITSSRIALSGAALMLVGLTTTAAVADTAATPISACANLTLGTLRVIDRTTGQRCLPGLERELAWNTTGPVGPAGPEGPAGPAGPAGADGKAGLAKVYQGYETNTQHTNYVVNFENTTKVVAHLALPAGSYLASAYFSLRKNDTIEGVTQATCILTANYTEGSVGSRFTLANLAVPTQIPYSAQRALTLTEPGTIDLACRTSSPFWKAQAVNIQMTATQVTAIEEVDIKVQ